MFFFAALLAASWLFASSTACPGARQLRKRDSDGNSTGSPATEWAYEASYNWGSLDPAYELCQTGAQQSPIPLRLDQGMSLGHAISFDYGNSVSGSLYNWGYGPAFDIAQDTGCTAGSAANDCSNTNNSPSITFEEGGCNETAYLVSWHIHSPADHSVQGDRSRSELHLVHVDASGHERAVLAIRIDPGLQ